MTEPAPAGFRYEHDSMGEVLVPENALYQSQTQRAVENFPVSGQPLPASLLNALALIKQAAAETNVTLNVIEPQTGAAVASAAAEVADALNSGHIMAEFPIDIYQTGSGTSSNMNMNEVLATLASQYLCQTVHPNDVVNASQSSNDVFPTAIHVAAASSLKNGLLPALQHLETALTEKAKEFAQVVKAGRTHLMDATPVTLGQEFGGYAAAIAGCRRRLMAILPDVATVPLGGTAVGTGINTPAGFTAAVCGRLAELTSLPITEAEDHFAAQWSRDSLVALSGELRALAVALTKICNDLRWMGSGPNAGLCEINIPDLQPGSSIMPGKVNPVIPESVLMVCARVVGNDATVAWAGASGNFELNVQMPVLAASLLESLTLLAAATRLLADRCVTGITANIEHCETLAGASPSIVTALNRLIGYEKAAEVAKYAVKHKTTIRDAVHALGLVVPDDASATPASPSGNTPSPGTLTETELNQKLNLLSMTHP